MSSTVLLRRLLVVFMVIVVLVKGCDRPDRNSATGAQDITVLDVISGSYVTVRIPGESSANAAERTASYNASVAAATPPEFCSNVVSFSETVTAFLALVDDQPGGQPFTPEVAATMHRLTESAELLTQQQRAITAEVHSSRTGFSSVFMNLLAHQRMVRHANFEPELVDLPNSLDDSLGDPKQLLETVSRHCPALVGTIEVTEYGDLPGPREERVTPRSEPELCPTAERFLAARNRHHAQITSHLNGVPQALSDAGSYAQVVIGGIRTELEEALDGAGLRATEGRLDGVFIGSRQINYALYLDKYPAERVPGTGYLDHRRSAVVESEADERALFEVFREQCPELDPDLLITGSTLRLFDAVLERTYGPRPSNDRDGTCDYVGYRLQARSEFRQAVMAGDVPSADRVQKKMYHHDAYNAPGVVWPTDFDQRWVSALERRERHLFWRLKEELPIKQDDDASRQIEQLVDWTQSNCPDVESGVDLPPVQDVLALPDQAEIAAHRQKYCVAARSFSDARLRFRSELEGGDTDAGVDAYRSLTASQQALKSLADQPLLLDPLFELVSSQTSGSVELAGETVLRQAVLADPPIVPWGRAGYIRRPVADVVQQICSFELPEIESAESVGVRLGLLEKEVPAELTLLDRYCAALESALISHTHFVAVAREVANGDTGAQWDALALYQRSQHSGSLSYQDHVSLFPGASAFVARFMPGGISYYVNAALSGKDLDSYIDALAADFEQPQFLAPEVIEACPGIPESITDIWIHDAAELVGRIDVVLGN